MPVAPPVRSSSAAVACCAVAVICTIAIVLGVRWFGPHDLYEKDQPKTMAYTADVVRHGQFSLPRDVIYQPATKPPMYNWIDAIAVAVSGNWSEWTLKLPSTLGVFATGAIVFVMAKRAAVPRAVGILPGEFARQSEAHVVIVGLIAVGVFFTFGSDVRHGSVLRLSYLARPDMLLTAFCTTAWACFTIAADRPTARSTWRPAVAGWLCVAAAALTKGPAALLPAVFAFVYPLLNRGRGFSPLPLREGIGGGVQASDDSPASGDPAPHPLPQGEGEKIAAIGRTWSFVGVLIVVVCVGLWLILAARQDATHVRQVIWGAEVAGRLTETPEGFRKPAYYTVMWFVTKAQPWGAVALVGLAATAWLPRLRRSAGPAAMYLAIVLIGLSLPAAKRMDYLLPAFAPAAVLVAVLLADVVRHRVLGAAGLLALTGFLAFSAADAKRPTDWLLCAVVTSGVAACLWVERRRPVPLAAMAALPLILAASFAHAFTTKFFESKQHWSDHAVAFVDAVRRHVRDDQSLFVLVRGKHPLTTLLGRHPGSYLTPSDLAAAEFVILPEQPDLQAIVTSEPLPEGFAELENRPLARLGLYEHVPLNRLVAAQKACGEWTAAENPYHAPGTVFRED